MSQIVEELRKQKTRLEEQIRILRAAKKNAWNEADRIEIDITEAENELMAIEDKLDFGKRAQNDR